MNKEQMHQAAKNFCDGYGKGLYNHPGTIEMASKFLQLMIDTGEVFERDSFLRMTEDTYRQGVKDAEGLSSINPLLITSQVTAWIILKSQCRGEFESAVSAAGKSKSLREIKDDVAKSYGFNDWHEYRDNHVIGEKILDMVAIIYANQFKLPSTMKIAEPDATTQAPEGNTIGILVAPEKK